MTILHDRIERAAVFRAAGTGRSPGLTTAMDARDVSIFC